MKVCIDPGHGMSNRTRNVFDPGATHNEGAMQFREADIVLRYSLSLRDELRAQGHSVFMTREDNDDHAPVGQRAKNARNADCDVLISLHLNDFDDDSANGLEVLYRGNANKGFAQSCQQALVDATALRDRGIKERRALAVLKFDGPAVLIELGFIANDKDRGLLLNPQIREVICETISAQLEEAELESYALENSSTLKPPASSVGLKDNSTSTSLDDSPVSKEEFLLNNESALLELMTKINARSRRRYSECLSLTQADLWVTFYAEMGIDGRGLINPNQVHSNGEHGLLPLPSNIKFWNGTSAPDPMKPMSLDENIFQFSVYLAQIKNKSVRRLNSIETTLYRDLFRYDGIFGDPPKEAIVMASVIHGYFFSGAYKSRSVPPYTMILEGIAAGASIDRIMSGTNYIHAGTDILRNRAKNIEHALLILET